MKPPRVLFINTDGGSLRIHPQLYTDGKVCLSILGTWRGPQWSAGMSLRTILLSLQSLLTEEPLRCEPGFEDAPNQDVERANVFVVHEAVRVLVIDAASRGASWGIAEEFAPLTFAMHQHILSRRAIILRRLASLSEQHDGQILSNPFEFSVRFQRNGRYNFASLIRLLSDLPLEEPPNVLQGRANNSQAVKAAHAAGLAAKDITSGEDDSSSESTTNSDGVEPCCRICHQTAEESGNPMITPCRCTGSISHVHVRCLLQWLQRPETVRNSVWRCDVCQQKYCVRLGNVGAPPGMAYLRRDIEVFNDSEFDAPGLVTVLLICCAQIMVTSVGNMISSMVHPFAVAVPLFMLVPAASLEFLNMSCYFATFAVKAMVWLSGPKWHPADWGAMGSTLHLVLDVITDHVGIYLGGQLHVLMLAVSCALLKIITQNMLDLTFLGLMNFVHGIEVRTRESRAAELYPSCRALLPLYIFEPLVAIHSIAAGLSLAINIFAILQLLARAFLYRSSIPVDVLPAVETAMSSRKQVPRPIKHRSEPLSGVVQTKRSAALAGGSKNNNSFPQPSPQKVAGGKKKGGMKR